MTLPRDAFHDFFVFLFPRDCSSLLVQILASGYLNEIKKCNVGKICVPLDVFRAFKLYAQSIYIDT